LVFRVPVLKVTAPTTVKVLLQVRVRSDLLMVRVLALAATSMVTVADVPELESNVTWSEEVGVTLAAAPPEVSDQ
jgi:hypothetical protein